MDEDNLKNIKTFFDYIKKEFKFILIISHLSSLKSVCDHFIKINKDENGLSYCRGDGS